jgi:hypothetical protein
LSLNYRNAYQNLYDTAKYVQPKHYPVAHYLLGLAAECALRSIIMRYKNSIDYSHKIVNQYEEALTLTKGGNKLLVEASKDINFLVRIWHNEDRYESVSSLYAKRLRGDSLMRELGISGADTKRPDVVCEVVKQKMQNIVLNLGKAAHDNK